VGKVIVRRFKGEQALQRGINGLAKKGYVVQNQTSRKKAFSVMTGVFTRQQIHTVTFTKPEPGAVADEAAPVSVADELVKLAGLHQSGALSDEEFASMKARLLDPASEAPQLPPTVS
jgi:hypothetical protein